MQLAARGRITGKHDCGNVKVTRQHHEEPDLTRGPVVDPNILDSIPGFGMRQHPFFRACHSMLANKNQGAVRSIEFRRGPHGLALQQFYSRVNIQHGQTATAVVTVQDDHLRRTPFIQSLDRRIDLARQQLARLLP